MKKIRFQEQVCTMFGCGNLPFPGIMGSAIGLIIAYALSVVTSHTTYTILILCITLLTYFLLKDIDKTLFNKDPHNVIIDEVLGFLVASIFVFELTGYLLAFIAFRIFDNLKPFPIRKLEALSNKIFAVFIDDIIAGIYAGLLAHVITSLL